jgi:periplasmic copper chaperone A
MTSPLRTVANLCAALVVLTAPAMAGSRIEVSSAQMQPAMPGADTTAIYLKFSNTGDEDDRLLGAAARDFGAVEIHEMTNEDGMMGMRPLIYGLKVEAGETLDLNPMTTHIMLINPRRTFKAGQKVPISLHFLKAGTIQLKATVQPYRPGANTDHTGHQGH